MTYSSPNIQPPSSDGPCEKAPMQAFGDQVVKNTPPRLTIKPIIYGLLLICGCFLSFAAAFAHPFAKDASECGVSVGEVFYSYRLINIQRI